MTTIVTIICGGDFFLWNKTEEGVEMPRTIAPRGNSSWMPQQYHGSNFRNVNVRNPTIAQNANLHVPTDALERAQMGMGPYNHNVQVYATPFGVSRTNQVDDFAGNRTHAMRFEVRHGQSPYNGHYPPRGEWGKPTSAWGYMYQHPHSLGKISVFMEPGLTDGSIAPRTGERHVYDYPEDVEVFFPKLATRPVD